MNNLRYLAMSLAACMALASCLNSDGYDYTYTDDAAITAFSLGTLNRYTQTVSSKTGNDTVVKSTVTGSNYKFYIDQEQGLIYNPDSLPYGTDGSHVICSVSSYNSGSVAIKSLTSDSLTAYSSSDSVDFSQPRVFQAYSLTGSAVREYEVSVNIHQQDPDEFEWTRLASSTAMGQLKGMRGATAGERAYVMGTDGSKARLFVSATDGQTWSEAVLPDGAEADAWQTLSAIGDSIIFGSGGAIYVSADGQTWSQTGATDGATLLGASAKSLFAIGADNAIRKSADLGQTWETVATDGDASYLPTRDISLVWRRLKLGTEAYQVLIVGNRDTDLYPSDTCCTVWGLVEECDGYAETQPMSHYPWSESNYYPLKRLSGIQCIRSGDAYFAIGAGGLGDTQADPFGEIYRSDDGGITWPASTKVTPPDSLTSATEAFAFFGDSSNHLWIVCGGSGDVWRGRVNEMGWAENQTSFTE